MAGVLETADEIQQVTNDQLKETEMQNDANDDIGVNKKDSGSNFERASEDKSFDSSNKTNDVALVDSVLASSCDGSQVLFKEHNILLKTESDVEIGITRNIVDTITQPKTIGQYRKDMNQTDSHSPSEDTRILGEQVNVAKAEKSEQSDLVEDSVHALYKSMQDRDYVTLKELVVEKKVNIDHVFTDPFIELPDRGWRLIHFLVKKGDLKGLKLVITLGADPNAKTDKGETALHICCKFGHFDCVDYLLTVNQSLKDIPDSQGLTPLLKALFRCDTVFKENAYLKTIKILINSGCDVNLSPDSNISPLHVVASKWDSAVIIELLINAGADVNAIAAQKGPLMTKFYSPLMTALNREKVNPAAVKLLIDAGANVNYENLSGKTPIHIAVSKSEDICVEHLLKAGADPNIEDGDFESPLWIAVSENNVKIAPLLLGYGGNVNFRNKPYHMSLLCNAVNRQHKNMVKILLDHGADVNAETALGASALHYAVDNGNIGIMKLLLQKNCEMENYSLFKDIYNPQSTFQIALNGGNDEVIKLLCEVGCPISEFSLKRERLPRAIKDDEELINWLYDFYCNPRTLLQICRVELRKICGSRLQAVTDSLSAENRIPHKLADCMLMKDLLE